MTQPKRKCFYLYCVLAAGLAVSTLVSGSIGGKQGFFANESDYSISFDKTTNKIGTEAFVSPSTVYSGTGTAVTGLGNDVSFEYNSFANPTTVWQLIKGGGYFTNTDPISGMKSITLTKSNTASGFQIYWSETTTFTEAKSATYDTTSALSFTCDFSGYAPNYIKVLALGTGTDAITSGSILFSCANQYPALTLTSSIASAGTTSGDGIYKIGSNVTVTATPNAGYQFIGWYHGTELMSTSASYSFTMPNCVNEYSLQAKFLPASYHSVVLTSEDEAKGTVSGQGMFNLGDSVTISASPSKGYSFSGWYDGSTLVSSENPYTFSMPYNNVIYVAKFVENSYDLSLAFDSTKGSATGAGTYAYKGSVSLSATPSEGYSFSGWYDGETLVSSANPYVFSMPYNSLSYEARFTVNQYTVALSSSEVATTPEGTCEVFGAGTYAFGSSVTVSATPAAGYGFLGWYDGSTLVSSSDSYTFAVPAKNVSYVAKYAKNHHVSVTSYDKTKGTVTGSGDYPYSSSVTVKANGIDFYQEVTWYDDSFNSLSKESSYTFTMPESDVSLAAEFAMPAVLGSSFVLGKYPQTVVEDSTLLTALASATDANSDGYLEYGSDEYKKITGAPYGSGYKSASGNVTFTSGTTYYFKVEPIQWRVLSGQASTTGLVMSEKILTKSVYYTSESSRTVSGSTVYANNYQYSTLRAMLNGYDGSSYSVGNFAGNGFLDVAFTDAEKAYITTTTVDNSAATTESSSNSYACANTSDRIFALSYQDLINASYGFNSYILNYDTARRGALTDYARATGAYMYTDSSSYYGSGCWSSRSPSADYSRFASYAYYGGYLYSFNVDYAYYGVRPSFIVDIS
jgi:hypothetical protein